MAGRVRVYRNAWPHRSDRRSAIAEEIRKDEGERENLVDDHELCWPVPASAVDRQLEREWQRVGQ